MYNLLLYLYHDDDVIGWYCVLPLSSGDVSVELDVVCHVAIKRMQRSVQWDVNISIV